MPGFSRGWPAALAAAAALAVGALLPLPAQAPPAPSIAARAETTHWRQAQETVLRQRSQAVLRRDEAAFMASVDPAASGEFRRRQRELFGDLAELPLASWDYQVEQLPGGDPARPRVELSYALAGVDAVPTRRPMNFTFTARGGRWFISADARPPHEPWDFGRSRVLRTEHGVIVGHDGTDGLAERLTGELDGAVASVTDVWGPDWSRQVGVLLPRSREELRALVGAEFAVDGIAAVAVADKVDVSSGRVEGPRVVLNTETASRLSDTSLRVVLRHEIAHVAARADTAEGAPMWLLEGFADYIGYRDSGLPPERIAPDLRAQARTGALPAAPPGEADFHQAGRRLDLAYQQSWSLIEHLVRRVGEPKVVELYRRIARAGTPDAVDPALRELAGISTDELLRGWHEELTNRFR
ncbi:hypothetical protein [Saccharopolyspora sp. SCSIO 74807]|uniref:hypothetical protein n=1 Tax=Saccharopolyspora sp. SCSIO 74807 TaxID=3118084 RepID=UPI0030D0D667